MINPRVRGFARVADAGIRRVRGLGLRFLGGRRVWRGEYGTAAKRTDAGFMQRHVVALERLGAADPCPPPSRRRIRLVRARDGAAQAQAILGGKLLEQSPVVAEPFEYLDGIAQAREEDVSAHPRALSRSSIIETDRIMASSDSAGGVMSASIRKCPSRNAGRLTTRRIGVSPSARETR